MQGFFRSAAIVSQRELSTPAAIRAFADRAVRASVRTGGNRLIGPSVRAANVEAFAQVLQSLGLDPAAVMAKAGLSEDAWDDPERSLSLYALDRIFVEAESATGCDHIGLLVGMRPADLGLPSYLLFNAPDLRSGLLDAVALIHLIHDGGTFALESGEGVASVKYANVAPLLKGAQHVTDCALAQMFGALKRYCGVKFQPEEIRLPRRPPADLAMYRTHFGAAKLVFNADEAAVDFPAARLAESNPDANPALYRFLKKLVADNPKAQEPLLARVRRTIGIMTFDGPVRRQKIATALGFTPQQLARRLRSEGASLQQLIAEVRDETALQLLNHTDLAIARIALALSYSDTSAFVRAFSKRNGLSPSAYRRSRAVAAAAG